MHVSTIFINQTDSDSPAWADIIKPPAVYHANHPDGEEYPPNTSTAHIEPRKIEAVPAHCPRKKKLFRTQTTFTGLNNLNLPPSQ